MMALRRWFVRHVLCRWLWQRCGLRWVPLAGHWACWRCGRVVVAHG